MAKMIVVGEAGFNNLKEARGYKGDEKNKTFSLELILSHAEAEAMVKAAEPLIDKLHAEAVEKEKAKGRRVTVRKPITLKDTPDGRVRVSFKRKEEDRAPMVMGKDKQPYESFLRKESRVKVAFEPVPYVMQGMFGVSLKLVGVQVLEDELTAEDLSKLFDDGDETVEETTKKEKGPVQDLF